MGLAPKDKSTQRNWHNSRLHREGVSRALDQILGAGKESQSTEGPGDLTELEYI